jgi:hypothetical protein
VGKGLPIFTKGFDFAWQRVYALNPPALAKSPASVKLIGVAKRATTTKAEALEPKAGCKDTMKLLKSSHQESNRCGGKANR